jgi:hypothetical protein
MVPWMLIMRATNSIMHYHAYPRRVVHAMGQLVEAVRYKPEGCGFNSHDVISGRTTALPLRGVSTRNISRGVKAASAWG